MSTITTINSSDLIIDSRAVINTNFTNLNTDKVEGQSASIDSEIALFSGTGGKTIKRATTTGILKGTSGVISAATAGTDYVTPTGTETLTNKTLTAPIIATISNTGVVTLPTTTTTLVGRDTTDTLTNKTLTSPVISSISNGGTVTIPSGTDTLVARTSTDTLTNKTLTAPVIATISNGGTVTIPSGTDTLVAKTSTDTLTNKTLTSSTNTLGAVTMGLGSDAQGDIYYRDTGVLKRLAIGSTNQVLSVSGGVPVWSTPSSGSITYWQTMPGTPTRTNGTTFTITDTANANSYQYEFALGTIVSWQDSGRKVAVVTNATYSSNTVTITIVGDSLGAGFSTMQYSYERAKMLTFAIPGTIGTGTDLAGRYYFPQVSRVLAAQVFHVTAGTTNATTYDINVNGSTIFTTKLSVASGATSSSMQAADSGISPAFSTDYLSIDCDSVSTTAPVDAYFNIYYFPAANLYFT